MYVLHLTCWLTAIGGTCCDRSVVHVLQLGSDEFVLFAVPLLPFTLCVLVNSFFACITVVSRGLMIGMSGESWCHNSTLSPICSFPDWACRSSSRLLCFRLRHIICF